MKRGRRKERRELIYREVLPNDYRIEVRRYHTRPGERRGIIELFTPDGERLEFANDDDLGLRSEKGWAVWEKESEFFRDCARLHEVGLLPEMDQTNPFPANAMAEFNLRFDRALEKLNAATE